MKQNKQHTADCDVNNMVKISNLLCKKPYYSIKMINDKVIVSKNGKRGKTYEKKIGSYFTCC